MIRRMTDCALIPHGARDAIMFNRTITLAAALLSWTTAPLAMADFTGFGSTSFVVQGDLHTYHIVEVYATFDNPSDRLLNVFDVTTVLANDVTAQPTAAFFQMESVEDEIPASFLPMPYLPPGEEWRFDTYVTIGAEQGNLFNGTVEDPSFVDAKFVTANTITGGAGWFNIPPNNGFGNAGSDLKVLLGVFVVTADSYKPGLYLGFTGTIGYSRNGAVAFASHARKLFYPSGAVVDYVSDHLDQDGKSDIVFYNPASRQVAAWLMEGLTRKAGAIFPDVVPAGYQLQGMGDLDGNASTDIVWRDASGRFHAWMTNGLSVVESAAISVAQPANVQCIGIGDISGDGRGDVVLRNTSTGEVTAWLMDGFVRIAEGSLGNASGQTCEAIADFDGDAKQDLLWRSTTGVMSVWLLNGLDLATQSNVTNVAGAVASSWIVAGAADISGDGKADVVWRHQSLGMVTGWLMNGSTRASGGIMHAGIPLMWRIEALRDIDDDGKYDLIWRNTANGDMNGWIMNGLSKASGGFIRNAQPQWAVVVP